MIMMVPIDSCMIGFGTGVVNSTVWSSILRAMPAWLAYSLNVLSETRARSKEKTTSSAVNGVPS